MKQNIIPPYASDAIAHLKRVDPILGDVIDRIGGYAIVRRPERFHSLVRAIIFQQLADAYPAATLYGHLGQASLYDVTANGNGYCDGVEPGPCGEPAVNEQYGDLDCLGTTQCDGAVGFDGPAGVGTPNGLGAFGAPPPPAVVTKSATKRTATSAVLNATVNPNGVAVSGCTFEWGPTALLGQVAPCTALPGAGNAAVAVSASISGLGSATYYYFRVSATNATAVATGKTLKLKTLA